ncbi:MAG: DNA mismatch repair endonuclease MutL [Pseudomonadota bacterium]
MPIRQLPDHLINQIAAGEVIERPAAAVKELVENAIDAGSTNIQIDLVNGGKSKIVITDNGHGMNAEDLERAVERHATSKLPDDDLVHINHLGFRGEALPSIGSVSRLNIKSKAANDDEAWEINIEGGKKSSPSPTSLNSGTTISVSDLFYATPARLKFLKTDRAEYAAIKDMVNQIAMAFPHIGFKLTHNGNTKLHYPVEQESLLEQRNDRLGAILGKDFIKNSVKIEAERENISLKGYASVPTLNRATTQYQYFFVNGRPVKDKMFYGCVRAAFMDVLHYGRHPLVALYLTIPPEMVDVNVHPAKSEVRFRDAAHIRGLIISTIKHALMMGAQNTSSSLASDTLNKMDLSAPNNNTPAPSQSNSANTSYSYTNHNLAEKTQEFYQPLDTAQPVFEPTSLPSARMEPIEETQQENAHPLGAARAQIHENYIIAQSEEGLVIVDQHAAHERLVYERLKKQMDENKIESQQLLVPEIIDLEDTQIDLLNEHAETLQNFGLFIESFGADSVAVQSIPAILGEKLNIKQLVMDIIDELLEHQTLEKIEKSIHEKLSSAACHGSIRSGRRMNADEMNTLLRQMEETEKSGHCNHGRPTYIKLDLKDIEKLFGRR